MFSPFKKPSGLLPDLNPKTPREDKPKKPMTPEVKRRLWATVILSVILLAIWYGCMALGEYLRNDALIYGVMIAYFVAFTAFLVAYLAYNRGFVNKDVTVEMLPADWSDEKKAGLRGGQPPPRRKIPLDGDGHHPLRGGVHGGGNVPVRMGRLFDESF